MTVSFETAIAQFEPELPLAVGFSGGADSTALLVACARKWPREVVAVHVNHGLQAMASVFEQHCQLVCAELSVELFVCKVDAKHRPGQSPEDAARRARYAAFDEVIRSGRITHSIKSIALAQHADDQIETILLALSRGSGVAGVSGMPAKWTRNGHVFFRPLLQVSSIDVRAWLRSCGVEHIEDPSNADVRFTRNYIRGTLTPVLETVFPQFRDTFARSAMHAAQANDLLDELAEIDAQTVCGGAFQDPAIRLIQQLSPARQSNFLRHWLKRRYGVVPTTAQLNELRRLVQACTTRGHNIHLKVGHGHVMRNGMVLAWHHPNDLC
ncbi:tRNA lysidine(34) synthetase TilS [Rhodoferax aquaticus]|uniref:tRNA(Ile)-lysidine synthase n=1 Tax=Rhodoferax aquaticus TaxID=2527691 RepID=A0A515ENP5_9BURK|nr:tRNA lysidine(34) synthetase TilS [Rhodoferax aquaticus]QDL54250.1 tRNA lysidine(34) synthetase TilS [Rhodoferax aquaticus]